MLYVIPVTLVFHLRHLFGVPWLCASNDYYYSGWYWSVRITFHILGFGSSISSRWGHANVHSYRHGGALWGRPGSLLFQVSFTVFFTFWNRTLVYSILIWVTMVDRYGSYPLKGKYCHEMALRILLASIEVFEMSLSNFRLLISLSFQNWPFMVSLIRVMQIDISVTLFLSSLYIWISISGSLYAFSRMFPISYQ